MSKRMRRALFTVFVGIAAVVSLSITVWIIVWSRDVPPPDVSDLLLDMIQVADASNAYTYFAKASQSLHWPENESAVESMLAGKDWNDAMAADLISQNAETLALLEEGLACSVYQPKDEGGSGKSKPLWQRHKMSELVALNAACERRMGNAESAWIASRDLLRFGAFVGLNPTEEFDCTLGMLAFGQGLTEIQRLLGEWSPDEPHLIELLNQLNSIESVGPGYARAVKMEFRFVSNGIDQLRSVRTTPLLGSYVFQPNRTATICAEYYRSLIESISQPYALYSRPPGPALVPVEGIHEHLLSLRRNSQGQILLRFVLIRPEAVDRIIEARCRAQSDLDGFRLVVACRIYEMHHGQLPDTLDALVPEVLGAVPQDPFDGRPFRYSREDAVVYSVGKDLKDSWILGNHAHDALLPNEPLKNTDDLVYHIHAAVTRSGEGGR